MKIVYVAEKTAMKLIGKMSLDNLLTYIALEHTGVMSMIMLNC